MIKFSLISDCHLNFKDLELPGGEVLIMAGDIMEAGHLRRADNAKKDTFIADRYRRFLNEELVKYDQVLYVLGNHEYYHNTFEDTPLRLAKELPSNTRILNSEGITIEDVNIFGGTLWTNMDKGNPMTMNIIQQGMNDYKCIKHGKGVKMYSPYGSSYYTTQFTPQFVMGLHRKTLLDLDAFAKLHEDEQVLVISHHAPCELSLDPLYEHDVHMNFGYHSALSDFILDRPNIRAWTHGHIHKFNDYMIGDCRVISNPRGYYGYELISNTFDPGFTFYV